MANLGHLTSLEAAERLNVDRTTIRRLVQRGALTPLTKLPGRTGAYLFEAADVEALAAERRAS